MFHVAHVTFQMVKEETTEVGFGTATGQDKDGLHIRITVAVYDPGMSEAACGFYRCPLPTTCERMVSNATLSEI